MDKTHYLKRELDERLSTDRNLFEWIDSGSLDGMWYWDLENPEHEWLSPQFKKLFGYQDHEIPHTSQWWQNNIFEEDLQAALDNFNKHCADPSHPYDQIVRYRHKDGSTVWVRCRGKVIFDDAGKPIRMLGAHTDLTPLMLTQQLKDKLTEELASLIKARHAVFNSMLDSVIVINHKGIIKEVNNATCAVFGYQEEEILGQNISVLMTQEDALQHDSYLFNHIHQGTQNIIGKGREVLAKKKSGHEFFARLSVAKYIENGEPNFVGTLQDIDSEVRSRKELEYSARYDHLTGLLTRKSLEQKAEAAISASIREGNTFDVLFLDLNKFKPINDSYGHDIGDEVLKTVAARLLNVLRESDVCARVGGDEFIALCHHRSNQNSIDRIIPKLKSAIRQPIHIKDLTLSVDTSIGGANYPMDASTRLELFSIADARMYADKSSRQVPLTPAITAEDLISITYISHSVVSDDEISDTCREIEKIASVRNEQQRISGILLYCQNRFIQRLEGPRSAVDALVDKIKRDPRHRNFILLAYHSITARSFADWSHMNVVTDTSRLVELDEFLERLEIQSQHGMPESESKYVVEYVKAFGN